MSLLHPVEINHKIKLNNKSVVMKVWTSAGRINVIWTFLSECCSSLNSDYLRVVCQFGAAVRACCCCQCTSRHLYGRSVWVSSYRGTSQSHAYACLRDLLIKSWNLSMAMWITRIRFTIFYYNVHHTDLLYEKFRPIIKITHQVTV